MPGLSYVCGAAETTLRMVTCVSTGEGPSAFDQNNSSSVDIMDMMQQLNADELLDSPQVDGRPIAPLRHRQRKRSVMRSGHIITDELPNDEDDGGGD